MTFRKRVYKVIVKMYDAMEKFAVLMKAPSQVKFSNHFCHCVKHLNFVIPSGVPCISLEFSPRSPWL